jgi:hypothetical protein
LTGTERAGPGGERTAADVPACGSGRLTHGNDFLSLLCRRTYRPARSRRPAHPLPAVRPCPHGGESGSPGAASRPGTGVGFLGVTVLLAVLLICLPWLGPAVPPNSGSNTSIPLRVVYQMWVAAWAFSFAAGVVLGRRSRPRAIASVCKVVGGVWVFCLLGFWVSGALDYPNGFILGIVSFGVMPVLLVGVAVGLAWAKFVRRTPPPPARTHLLSSRLPSRQPPGPASPWGSTSRTARPSGRWTRG